MDVCQQIISSPFGKSLIIKARHHLEECICNSSNWMRKQLLKLNYSEMEFIIIGNHSKLCHLRCNDAINIRDSIIKASPSVRNIGAIFDRPLTMKDNIHAIGRVCYCYILNMGMAWSHITKDAAVTLIRAFLA